MDATHPRPRLPRAWYSASFPAVLTQSTEAIIGHLTRHSALAVEPMQRDAWLETIALLKQHLAGRTGHLLLEFNIPRMGLRVDAVLLAGGCVLMLEFTVNERAVSTEAHNQAWEYALETKNFHEHPGPLDAAAWIAGRCKPTPTIIEAARHLYANHSVADIVRTEADERNLSDTARRVESLIERARAQGEKIVIFVTGVPGAGKTLVGLNIATSHREQTDTHAVFLSGNGPLVTVLREALTRDDVARRKQRGERISKATASKPIKAFIQNVHHFRDEGLRDREKPPVDRIVIFDEAQRAWNREKAERWMRTRKGVADFQMSEPEFRDTLESCQVAHGIQMHNPIDRSLQLEELWR